MAGRLLIFSGNANRALAEEIVACLHMTLGRAMVGSYENGETRIKLEDNVRGCDVFVIQPTSTPVNQNLVELLMIIDALRRASVARVTAVIPYYGYAKQEKKTTGREPIAAKLVANLMCVAGADRILTIDMHAPAIEGFFDIPVDHLQGTPLLADYIAQLHLPNVVVVSPDAGGVARANSFRERLGSGASLAIIAHQRPELEDSGELDMIGEVAGKTAVVVDDMISTGKTLLEATRLLRERGASDIYFCATHGVFAARAVELVQQSRLVKTIVTNTITLPPSLNQSAIQVISVAPLFAEAIMRIHKDLSLSVLFAT